MKNLIKISVLSALLVGLTVDVSAQQRNKMQDKAKDDRQGQSVAAKHRSMFGRLLRIFIVYEYY